MNISQLLVKACIDWTERRQRFVKVLHRREGQTMVEWTVIIGVVVGIIVVAVPFLRAAVIAFFAGLAAYITSLIPEI